MTPRGGTTAGRAAGGAASRALLACGVAGPALFIGGSALIGAVTPGYDPARSFVSELSRTPSGPAMKAVFLASGLLILLAAAGFRSAPSRPRVVPAVVAVLGLCLAASGLADTDRAVLFAQSSPEGRVHGLLGAVVFVSLPVVAALCGRAPVLGPRFRAASPWAAGVLVAGDVLLKAAELAPGPLADARGLVQRAVLVVGLGWLATAAGLTASRTRSPPQR